MAGSAVAAEARTVAATAIARHGHVVLLRGASGAGKSDFALRAICRPLQLPGETTTEPFRLVSDDQTVLTISGNAVLATAPAPLRALLEVRGIGLVNVPATAELPLALVVDFTDAEMERMPDYPGPLANVLGHCFDLVQIAPFEASAPEKVALALARSVKRRASHTA